MATLKPGARAKGSLHLTTTNLRAYAPEAGSDIVWDTELTGFGLRTRGRASPPWNWVFAYRHKDTGKQVKLALGRYPGVTPEQARQAARKAEKVSNTSDDLFANRSAQRAAVAAEKARPTVAVLWSEYWAAEGGLKKAAKGYERLWENHLQPFFGRMKVAAVSPQDVERFKVERRATPGACNRALALLSRMMTLAVRYGYRARCAPEHPVKGVERYPETPSEFYFSMEELGRLLEAADQDADQNTRRIEQLRTSAEPKDRRRLALAARWTTNPGEGLAIRMLAFTGARASEVLGAHWDQFEELDGDRLLWTVESTNTKIGRPVTRALDADLTRRLLAWKAESLAIRARSKLVTLNSPRWVFPQLADPSQPLKRIAHAWDRIKKAAGVDRGRIHDLRHTAATLIVRHTKSLAAAQFQLGHATPLTTRRYAHLMREGMIETGDLLAGVASKAQAEARKKRGAKVSKLGVREA